MIELGLALGFVALVGGGALAWGALGADALLGLGAMVILAGFALGIPTGLWYHVELRRALLGAGALPARWWLHPTRLHPAIPEEARARVLGWCAAGALGWLVSVAGCVVFGLGAAKIALGSP
jgi:hypothetical protein